MCFFELLKGSQVLSGGNVLSLEELYEKTGGNYGEVLGRLMTPQLVRKFALKFLDDGSFNALCNAVESGNREEAFRAAHTLKGVCQNLGFGNLLASSSRITEILRAETDAIPAEAKQALEDVKCDYRIVIESIRMI